MIKNYPYICLYFRVKTAFKAFSVVELLRRITHILVKCLRFNDYNDDTDYIKERELRSVYTFCMPGTQDLHIYVSHFLNNQNEYNTKL